MNCHPKPIVHYELNSLLSLAHTLNPRDPQHDQSGLATHIALIQPRPIQYESTDPHWVAVPTDCTPYTTTGGDARHESVGPATRTALSEVADLPRD